MIRMRKRLYWLLPTVVLCLLAERPMALAVAAVAFNQSHSFKTVICSSHGSMVIDETLGSPENDIQKPVCPWFPWLRKAPGSCRSCRTW
jgi:hypothetical protein